MGRWLINLTWGWCSVGAIHGLLLRLLVLRLLRACLKFLRVSRGTSIGGVDALRRIRIIRRILVELRCGTLSGIAALLLLSLALLSVHLLLGIALGLLVEKRLRLLGHDLLRRHADVHLGGLLRVGGLARLGLAEEVGDVGEGCDEEEHENGRHASGTAENGESGLACYADLGALRDDAGAAINETAIMGAGRLHVDNEGSTVGRNGAHGGQPEEDHESIKRQRGPGVVSLATGWNLLGNDIVDRDDPCEDDLLRNQYQLLQSHIVTQKYS